MEILADADDLRYRYIIGIDLGTTNSAVAYVDLGQTAGTRRKIRFFEVPQLVAPGEVAPQAILPSFLYVPGSYDLPLGSTALPWAADRDFAVGTLAREQGANVPGRLVASAKSWLCHGGVDRTADILPWEAKADVAKVSPVEASTRYLQHIREAWNATQAQGREEHLFEEQLVVVTVPASFDEVARELTLNAAKAAGIPRAVLLEEPLAAFYAWLSEHEDTWQDHMHDGQLILVCDVGGGTTDFSLVGIKEGESGLHFNRLAVGDHLMLGGDNMDLTLGRFTETKLMGQPGKLDAQRWPQLVHQCRKAKETLLSSDKPDSQADITLMGQSGKLIAGTLKSTLTYTEIEQVILEGFFPEVELANYAAASRRAGLTEWGLPYVQDAAITRHLASFWYRFADYLRQETEREALFPDFILFNGGVLTPASIRQRLLTMVGQWFEPVAGAWLPTELVNPRPELAVAVGATYYGLVRQGEGVRVGSGSPRAYFVGVGADATNEEIEQPAVCLVPRGTEEGFSIALDQPRFEALTNQPVAFHLFSSSTRLGDALGDIVDLPPEEVTVLPPIRTVLRFGKGEARTLPVQLGVHLTEIGILEIWCSSEQTDHRWQLQFDVRQSTAVSEDAHVIAETIDHALVDEAKALIQRTFVSAKDTANRPEQLRKRLEALFERPQKAWPTPLIRTLADTLLDLIGARRLSAAHEARWLNLLGFCLRPGFGDPVDEWRMKTVWKLYFEGLQFPRQTHVRSEWWIFWRRVAGGLNAGKQRQIHQQVRPYLEPGKKKKPSRMFPKNLSAREELEIWMALANFERLPVKVKAELGRLMLRRFKKGKLQNQELWALSRLGARQTIYGPLDRVVPSQEVESWIKAVLDQHLSTSDGAANALIQLARFTGDRKRDVSPKLLERVENWLRHAEISDRYVELLKDPTSQLQREAQSWMFGESLPTGLVLKNDDATG